MISSVLSHFARRATLVAGLGCILLGAGACVENQDFVTIDRMVWFDDFSACAIMSGDNQPTVMTVDVEESTQFSIGVIVSNNLSQNAGSNSGIDDTQIRVTEVEVSLSFAGGALTTGSFRQSVPNFTLSGGDSGSILVFVGSEVSDELSALMQGGDIERLEMSVVVLGERTGGVGKTKAGQFESAPSVFPFEICKGCLVQCGFSTCGMWQSQMPPPGPDCGVTDTTDTGTTDTGTTDTGTTGP